MHLVRPRLVAVALFASLAAVSATATPQPDSERAIVARAIAPVMERYGIPGMAVGVTIDGRHHVYNFGVASKATGRRVADDTLFEIGSITKTYTATLASYAAERKALGLSDMTSADFPRLRGTAFDRIPLLDLGTHTSGGLPLQLPDAFRTDDDAIAYYTHWKPAHPPGTYRLYSNPGIMLLGAIAADRLGEPFASAMRRHVFAPLALRDTFLDVPAHALPRYAQGYTEAGKPRRMITGPLAAEAYGIRTTARDVVTFVDANMGLGELREPLGTALRRTHTGYYTDGPMTQDLIWEQYAYPTTLAKLLQGNSEQTIFDDNAVTKLRPPEPPAADVLMNKTGSTAGFAAYVAFVPRRRIGVVILANRSYPIEARIRAAYAILSALQH